MSSGRTTGCAREPVGLWASKAKIDPSVDSFADFAAPSGRAMGQKGGENGPLRSICSRRSKVRQATIRRASLRSRWDVGLPLAAWDAMICDPSSPNHPPNRPGERN